jgi:hypothetical protein
MWMCPQNSHQNVRSDSDSDLKGVDLTRESALGLLEVYLGKIYTGTQCRDF